MRALLNTTEKLFVPAEADRVAKEMQDGDPGWTYTAVHDPKGTGYSFVEIRDEDGEFVGKV